MDKFQAVRAERDELLRREELCEQLPDSEDVLMIITTDLPSGRRWTFIEDAKVLAVAPDIDEGDGGKANGAG